jgi:hypothetical protein
LSSYGAFVFSSKKLEIRVEQILPGNKGGGQRKIGRRNDPNNAHTCE